MSKKLVPSDVAGRVERVERFERSPARGLRSLGWFLGLGVTGLALLLATVLATSLSVAALNWAASAESAAHAHDAAHLHAPGHDQPGGHEHPTGVCQPTAAQSAAAARLVADTKRGLARFADLRDALAAGYAPHDPG